MFLTLPFGNEVYSIGFNTIITWIAALVILIVLIFEDNINEYIARKRMFTGTERAISNFNESAYSSTSNMGKTEWLYENISLIAETNDYFVFIFDKSHAQVYDKNNMTGGTVEEFRKFISGKTGKEVQQVR